MDIFGTVGNDSLDGTAGSDTIILNGGIDTVHAGDGDDQIVLNAPVGGLNGAGTVLDGGAGFDTLVLKPQLGFPNPLGSFYTPYVLTQATLTGIEGVRFDTTARDAIYLAVFDQQILANGMTNLTGGAGRDILIDVVFTPGTYLMPNFTFTNWTSNILDPTSDYVSLFVAGSSTGSFTLNAREGLASTQALSGGLGNDILNGSSGSEFLTASRGVDQLYGNGGTDVLIAENLAPFGGSPSTFTFAGDIFDGGAGVDALQIGGSVNLTAATITNMEWLYLEPAFAAPLPGTTGIPPSYLTITASQATSGFATDTLLLGAGIVEIQVGSGQSLNVSGWHLGTNSTVSVIITGTSGNETITGTGGDDTINGRGGVDVIHAGAGDDAIVLDTQLGFGSVLDGGDGFDTLVLGPPAGSPGPFGQNQVFYSPYFPTTLTSIEAITFLSGPNDFIGVIVVESQRAASGLNTLIGGAGRDVLYDVVFTPGTYTMPNFTLVNWTSNIRDFHSDIVTLVVSPQSTGDYVLNAREGLASTQSLIGGSGNDILNGSSGSEFLDGRGGINQLFGNAGNDALLIQNSRPFGGALTTYTFAGSLFDGGDGTDAIEVGGLVNFQGTLVSIERIFFDPAFTATAPNQISFDPAHLILTRDQTAGLAANLSLFGNGTLEVNLSAGQSFSASAYTVDAGYTVGLILNGSTGNETITGSVTSDIINGGDGNDLIEGRGGNDTLNGGNGSDTASYANASGAVTVDLGAGTASGADGNDTLASIENVTGSAFNDELYGGGGDNVLQGLGGNDYIQGGNGSDTIYGGDGDDFLLGDLGENFVGYGGNDILEGGNGNDILRGGLGNDQLFGGANNDLLRGNGGVDYFDGGSDDGEGINGIGDRVSFYDRRATQGAVADLRTGIISNDGFGNVETMVNIESLGADTAYVDTFYGDDNRNYIAGGRGDNLYGFGGDDRFQMGAAAAVLDGGLGIDLLALDASGGWLMPDTNADGLAEVAAAATTGWTVNLAAGMILDGYGNVGTVTGIENLNGSQLNDTLIGDANANIINGGDDNDLIEGRGGNDTIDGGIGTDTASYANASGSVTVDLGAGTASGADGDDTLLNIENVTGSAFNDSLLGNGGANTIDGGAGDDGLFGFGGNDTLLGGDGNDFLKGGNGDDIINGGAGYDRAGYYQTNAALGGVTVDLRIVGPQNTGSQGWDTLVGIENVSGTPFADTLTGDAGDNWLWGSSSWLDAVQSTTNNDTIDGGGGNDLIEVGYGNHILTGGSGNDTLLYSENGSPEVGVSISLALQGGAQTTGAGNWTLSGFENLSGGTGNDQLTGDGSANVLAGGDGSDILVGGGGDDSIYGDGSYGLTGTGGSGSIILLTDANVANGAVGGNDTLEGGLGNDLINGGIGSDTASYANASGSVTVDLGAGTASGADGNDILVSIENVTGSANNDSIFGNAGANVLTGGAGHDILGGDDGDDSLSGGTGDDLLNGGAGNDLLDGGAGIDRVAYAVGATAGVRVDLNIQGIAQATGSAGMDTLIGIEQVSGTIYNDVLIGNAGDNWLWGGSNGSGVTGNDNISGGAGNDLIEVGAGTHVLDGGTGIDTLSLWGNATDISSAGVKFSLALQGTAQNTQQGTMTANGFENVSGSRFNDVITGDAGANTLVGDTGNDMLNGGDGNDIIYGDGRIIVDGHAAGTAGAITLYGDVNRDIGTSTGLDGNDILNGGKGDDTLYGGRGNDVMSGGPGADRFIIEALSGTDRITDFAHVDKVVFDAFAGPHAFSELVFTAVGKDVMITWGTGDSLVIEGYRPRDLTAADFNFTPAAAPLAATSFAAVDSSTATAGYLGSDFAGSHLAADMLGHTLIFG